MDETGTMLEGGLREWMSDATHPAPVRFSLDGFGARS